jgi:uncharacterized membrane protein
MQEEHVLEEDAPKTTPDIPPEPVAETIEPPHPQMKPPRTDMRTGLIARVLESKVLFIVFFISLFWIVSIFIVPYMISPGTVTNLDGGANRIDYGELWDTLPPFPKLIYYAGDAECHQISNRTIYLNGNQMPICTRDVSIFLFLSVGLFLGMLAQRNYYISAGMLSIFPKRFRDIVNRRRRANWFTVIFIVLCLVPLGIDGGLQLFTGYESTNLVRFLTGLPAGLVVGLLFGVIIKSVKATKEYKKEIEKEGTEQPGP